MRLVLRVVFFLSSVGFSKSHRRFRQPLDPGLCASPQVDRPGVSSCVWDYVRLSYSRQRILLLIAGGMQEKILEKSEQRKNRTGGGRGVSICDMLCLKKKTYVLMENITYKKIELTLSK